MVLSKLLQLLLVDWYTLSFPVLETNVVADVPACPVPTVAPSAFMVASEDYLSRPVRMSYRGGGNEPSPTMFRHVSGRKRARRTNATTDKISRNQNILRHC